MVTERELIKDFLNNCDRKTYDEVKDLVTSDSPRISQYCTFYTDHSKTPVTIKTGEVMELKNVPQHAHWEPGHIYEVTGISSIKAIGCFSLSETGRYEITDQKFREHLGGIVEPIR